MIDAAAESTYKAADAMMERGGSFVKELGAAWYVADPINKAKLCLTFEHYFVRYGADNTASFPADEMVDKEKCITAFKHIVLLMEECSDEIVQDMVDSLNGEPNFRHVINTIIDVIEFHKKK